jgi:GNAT superfamily N-acetyltransferase
LTLRFYSYDERPDLEERKAPGLEIWPAFMLESEVSNRCWGLLYERFGAFQHFLYDEDADEVVAEVNSVPVRVDVDDLPDRGWEDVLERGTAAEEEPTAVTAIAVAIRPSRLGQGLSSTCLVRMRDVARGHGFHDLVAPVRPSWKPRYPLVPIDRYIGWTTAEGQPFDPWLRTHARLGAAIVRPCHNAMRIEGTVAEWEQWAGMLLPESGDYVVPGALTLVSIDREADHGVYVEPNVWMHHRM